MGLKKWKPQMEQPMYCINNIPFHNQPILLTEECHSAIRPGGFRSSDRSHWSNARLNRIWKLIIKVRKTIGEKDFEVVTDMIANIIPSVQPTAKFSFQGLDTVSPSSNYCERWK